MQGNTIKKRKTISPSTLDDRYLSYIGYNWLQAFIESKKLKFKKQKFEDNFIKSFDIAMIYIKSTPHYYFIINYNKGTFKAFLKRTGKSYIDSGIIIDKENRTYIMGLSDSVQRFSSKDNSKYYMV